MLEGTSLERKVNRYILDIYWLVFSQCCSARNLNKYKHKSLIVDDISRSRRSDGNFLGFARLRVRGFSGEGEKKMVEILFISSFDLYSILDEYYILYPWKDLLNFVQIFCFFFLNNPPLFFLFPFPLFHKILSQISFMENLSFFILFFSFCFSIKDGCLESSQAVKQCPTRLSLVRKQDKNTSAEWIWPLWPAVLCLLYRLVRWTAVGPLNVCTQFNLT